MREYEYRSGFADDIRGFFRLRSVLGYSASSYGRQLADFDRYCMLNHPEACILTKDIFLGWMKRRETELTGKGYNSRLGALNAFARYQRMLGRKPYVDDGELRLREEGHDAFLFTADELDALFAAADALSPSVNNDTRHIVLPVMLRLMYCCGLRPNEVRRVRLDDVSLTDRILVIHMTKNRRDRKVLLSESVCRMIDVYIERISTLIPGMTYLFENPRGGPYSSDWLKSGFRICVSAAGIGCHGGSTPRAYDLRHTFATDTIARWLREGRDVESHLPYLMAYMGHKRIEHTLYYVHMTPESLLSTGLLEWEEDDG